MDLSITPGTKTALTSALASLLVEKILIKANPFGQHSLIMAAASAALPLVYSASGLSVSILNDSGYIAFPVIAAAGTYYFRSGILGM